MDFGISVSIYATDPNGILVEFSCWVRPFTAQDRANAQRDLNAAHLEFEIRPVPKFFPPVTITTTW